MARTKQARQSQALPSGGGGKEVHLRPEEPAHEAARAIHLSLLDALLANLQGVVEDRDPEFLHDFRVAGRRTRVALSQIPDVFPPRVVRRFQREFKWLGSRTGPTRDLDVYLLHLPSLSGALSEADRARLRPLTEYLQQQKRVEHGRLRRTLASRRFERLIQDWRAFLTSPGPSATSRSAPARAREPILDVASERILSRYEKVLEGAAWVAEGPSPESLHRLRIRCKKLRYLMFFFQVLYPEEEVEGLLKELRRLQDTLGAYNDLQFQRAGLGEFAARMRERGLGEPATFEAMRALGLELEGAQARELEVIEERVDRFSRPENQERFAALFAAAIREPT